MGHRADLATQAAQAVRNHVGSLVALLHVLKEDGRSDREVVAALRGSLSRLALDAELLVDLAGGSADRPDEAASVDDLLREAVRSFAWLEEVGGSLVKLGAAPDTVADGLTPSEVVAVCRRLVAAVVAATSPAVVVLEARYERGALCLQARSDALPPFGKLADALVEGEAGQLDMAALARVLDRPGLRVTLAFSPDRRAASARLQSQAPTGTSM